MRITKGQLQTIIREELIRTMAQQTSQKGQSQIHESIKSMTIGVATGIRESAIEKLLPVFSAKKPVTPEEATAIARDVIKVDYEGNVNKLISDFRGAIARADAIAPVIAKLVPEGKTLALKPVSAVIKAIEKASGKDLSDIFTAVKAMSKRLTGSEGM